VEHDARNIAAMRAAVERAAKMGAPAVPLDILRATAANSLGEMELAVSCATRAASAAQGPNLLLAVAVLAESLYLANRIQELSALLDSNQTFKSDPRGQLLLGRIHRRAGRSSDAESTWRGVIANSAATTRVRHLASSELAKLLDSVGNYAEAFRVATVMHTAFGAPFDTGGLVWELEATLQLCERGAFKHMTRADGPMAPAALICALPRSGTTLVEQMLDRHSRVHGLGESPAVHALTQEFTRLGGWPQGTLCASPADLQRLREGYTAQTRAGLSNDIMTLDKSVQTWRRLPAVAAALPGAKLIRLRRDPRDTAISLYLSAMDPRRLGWTASLDDIKRVITAERRCVPVIAQSLQMFMIDMSYEDLVREPKLHMERVLNFLELPWEDACLAPEGNARVAITLSNEQVRRPLNADSIGRWQNYAEHFDAGWSAVAT
jgi:hypothetical protein